MSELTNYLKITFGMISSQFIGAVELEEPDMGFVSVKVQHKLNLAENGLMFPDKTDHFCVLCANLC